MMFTRSLFLSGAIVSLAWAYHAPAAVIMEDKFDSYAGQAAFEAVWERVTTPAGVMLPSGVLSTLQSVTPPNSIHNAGTTDNTQANRNQRLFEETGVPDTATDNVIRFSFGFYDSNPAVNPFRHHTNLQDGTGASASGQLIAMGMNNNQFASDNGGNYYMGRILGYNPNETRATSSGAFFKLNAPGAPLRSTGWHNLAVEISDLDFRFFVDGILSEIVPNTFALRSYDVVRLGSGLSNAGHEAFWDNVRVETIHQNRPSVWNEDVDDNWSSLFGWTGDVPNAAGPEAVLGDIITAPRTITLDSSVTVGRLTLQNENAYTIAGPGPLTLNSNVGPGVIHAISGSHTISAPLTLADNTAIGVDAADKSLSLTGPLNASGVTVTKSGAGTLNINGSQTIGPGTTLTVSDGTANINTNAGSSTGRNLTVNANSATNFGASQHLAALSVGTDATATITAGNSKNVVTGGLSIAGGATPTATLDVTNNAVVVNFPAGGTAPADIRDQIVAGRGGAGLGRTWNGLGITSSAAAAAVALEPESRSIGYAENASLPLGPYANFRGEPVDDTSILIAFTRTGDANLDGVVNDDDVTIVGATYAPGVPQPHWALGDFDYNGFVDDDDVTLLGVFYDPSALPPTAAAPANPLVISAVPEPSTLVLFITFAIGLVGIIARRQ
ncbi:MAG: hypothetical protein WD894_02185 [Pirellulales bacterium]